MSMRIAARTRHLRGMLPIRDDQGRWLTACGRYASADQCANQASDGVTCGACQATGGYRAQR